MQLRQETEANNINKAKAAIATLGEDIAALFEGVKKLDGEVAEAAGLACLFRSPPSCAALARRL